MNDVDQLITEIFKMTGQKVALDDPIVAAALINSQLIRQAGQDATKSIQTAADQMLLDLAEAVKSERQAAAHAYKEVVASARVPSVWKIKITLGMSVLIFLGGVAGGIVGASLFDKHGPSKEEARQLAAGKEYLQILPQLDEQTRNKLVRAMEERRSQ